ncbi:MAG: cupin domain-containing protein [Proteobacteria bacterium]|nr:cupin domain-containing protein [Pseudomonadota bacterium]
MTDYKRTLAIAATDVPTRTKVSNYPEPFFTRMTNRKKKALGEYFSLKNFGVNLTRLAPGGESALMHTHKKQDEMIYVIEGHPTLVTESGEVLLSSGMCAGFPANGEAHHLVNRSDRDVLYLEIGDRTEGDEVCYPNDDIRAALDESGTWRFTHKDGTPYQADRYR